MSITPNDLLKYAEAVEASCELDCRMAISRGYYAAYHAALQFHDALPSGGIPPATPVGVHATLFHQLSKPTISDEEMKRISRKIGIIGKDLKRYREDSDYELDESIPKEHVDYVLAQAQKVLEIA